MTNKIYNIRDHLPDPQDTTSYGWSAVEEYLNKAGKVLYDLEEAGNTYGIQHVTTDASRVVRALLVRQQRLLETVRSNYEIPPKHLVPNAVASPARFVECSAELCYFMIKVTYLVGTESSKLREVMKAWQYAFGEYVPDDEGVSHALGLFFSYIYRTACSGWLTSDYGRRLYKTYQHHCSETAPLGLDNSVTSTDLRVHLSTGEEFGIHTLSWLLKFSAFPVTRFVELLEGMEKPSVSDAVGQAVQLAGRTCRALASKDYTLADKQWRFKEIVGTLALITGRGYEGCINFWPPIIFRRGGSDLLMVAAHLWIELLIHSPDSTVKNLRDQGSPPMEPGGVEFTEFDRCRAALANSDMNTVMTIIKDSRRTLRIPAGEFKSGLREIDEYYTVNSHEIQE